MHRAHNGKKFNYSLVLVVELNKLTPFQLGKFEQK